MNALISCTGYCTFKASHLCSFVLWRSYRHEGEAVDFLSLNTCTLTNYEALEIANINDSQYRKLLTATSGVVFLGSPLQGTKAGKAAQWRAMLAGILNKAPSQTLLEDLDGSTRALRRTSENFVTMMKNPPMQTMMTICFWESQKTQLLKAVLPSWTLSPLSSLQTIVSRLLLNRYHCLSISAS